MKELIEKMEQDLQELKKQWNIQQEKEYRAQEHKDFKKDDYVTNGDIIGIVGWTENKHMNIVHEDGYMGVNIINKKGGFIAPVKRDEFTELETSKREYYENIHTVTFQCNGISIDRFMSEIHYNLNPFDGKTSLLDSLNYIRNKTFR